MNIATLCLKQQEAKRRKKKNKRRWDAGDEEKDKEEPRIKCREMMRACDRETELLTVPCPHSLRLQAKRKSGRDRVPVKSLSSCSLA